MGAATVVAACVSLRDVTIITRGTPSNAHRMEPLSPYTSPFSPLLFPFFIYFFFFFIWSQLLCKTDYIVIVVIAIVNLFIATIIQNRIAKVTVIVNLVVGVNVMLLLSSPRSPLLFSCRLVIVVPV